MKCTVFGLFLLLGLCALAPAADPAKKITIRWQGQSFFQIETGDGTLIVTDPHAMPEFSRSSLKADVVTISHLHSDHVQLDVLESKEPKVIYGLDPKAKKSTFKPVKEKFRNVLIRNVSSDHDLNGGLTRGKNSIFIFETDGLKICHLGDLGTVLTPAQVKEIGPVDILMIPVGGIYTINGEQAKEVVAQLKPRLYILPMHYGTKILDTLQPPDEFLDGQKNVKRLDDTNVLTVPVDLKLDSPAIVVLSWK